MSSIALTIVPHLRFDKEAIAAAEFYISLFPDSRITKSPRSGTRTPVRSSAPR